MKEEKETLIEEASSLQKSIDWWIRETSLACEAVDEIDILPNVSEEEIEVRYNRLKYLISKTDVEIKEVDKLENKYRKYFNKIHERNKSKNAKVVRRKKRNVSE
jgi:hypothetical protein